MTTPKHLTPLARSLRQKGTDAERLLWQALRGRQISGVKFRRQQPLEGYIVDFVAFTPKLVIELDGGQHAETIEADERRDTCLQMNGFTVLRFWNNEVLTNTVGVLEAIHHTCLTLLKSSSSSSVVDKEAGHGMR